MNTVAKTFGDDLDLDALMDRVRDAALTGASGTAPRPHAAGEGNGAEVDLARILDAQGEWNEQARQSLAALVECVRTLRDDWADAHARLQEEVRRLSAEVTRLRARRPATKRRTKGGRRRS